MHPCRRLVCDPDVWLLRDLYDKIAIDGNVSLDGSENLEEHYQNYIVAKDGGLDVRYVTDKVGIRPVLWVKVTEE